MMALYWAETRCQIKRCKIQNLFGESEELVKHTIVINTPTGMFYIKKMFLLEGDIENSIRVNFVLSIHQHFQVNKARHFLQEP
jgi:hypothetical protein